MPGVKLPQQVATVTTQAELAAIKTALANPAIGKEFGDRVRYAPTGSTWEVGPIPGALPNQAGLGTGTTDFSDFTADVDLSGWLGLLVSINPATGRLRKPTTAGEPVFGQLITVASAAIGAACIVRVNGAILIVNAGGVTAGDFVRCTGAAGTVETVPPGGLLQTIAAPNPTDVNGSWVVGRALQSALAGVPSFYLMMPGLVIPATYV